MEKDLKTFPVVNSNGPYITDWEFSREVKEKNNNVEKIDFKQICASVAELFTTYYLGKTT